MKLNAANSPRKKTPTKAKAVQLTARAKINLALHVTGQRDDGYHLLDTLVTFAEHGDTLSFEPADQLSLTIGGPEGAALHADDSNLILKAAHAVRDHVGRPSLGAAIHLSKNLPIASGIGGGSADAATTILGLCRLWKLQIDEPDLMQLGLSLGADIPMCLAGVSARVTGIGESVEPMPVKPLNLVLANPRVEVSTPEVFRDLTTKKNPRLGDLSRYEDRSDRFWINYLMHQRNDLQSVAVEIAPQIADCLAAMEAQPDCMLARMSGSGATCFGIFENPGEAAYAAHELRNQNRNWWVVPTRTIAPTA